MTELDFDVHFDNHKTGIQSNQYVKQYGMRLLPDLYEGFNSLTYDEAVKLEIEIGMGATLQRAAQPTGQP